MRSRAAIYQCLAQEIPIVIATSRPARTVYRLLGEELVNECSLVLMNGALAMGAPPLSGALREALPSSVARSLVELILDLMPDVRVVIELNGQEFGANTRFDDDLLWRSNFATPDMVLTLEQALQRHPTKVAVNGLGHDLSLVAAEVSSQFGDDLSVLPADGATFLNVVSHRASKSHALRHLLDPHGVSLSNVIAFGDDLPDIDMLKECGISIAVANATPTVKATARYETASNDEDGVAIALEQLIGGPPE
jgi:hypothetical protein